MEKKKKNLTFILVLLAFQDIAEANFRTSSSRLLAAVMSALCNTSVKLTSILPIAYDGEVLLRSLVKQVSTENDSALAHRFPLLVAHMEKLSHVSSSYSHQRFQISARGCSQRPRRTFYRWIIW